MFTVLADNCRNWIGEMLVGINPSNFLNFHQRFVFSFIGFFISISNMIYYDRSGQATARHNSLLPGPQKYLRYKYFNLNDLFSFIESWTGEKNFFLCSLVKKVWSPLYCDFFEKMYWKWAPRIVSPMARLQYGSVCVHIYICIENVRITNKNREIPNKCNSK